jgi:ABC-type Na+ efflux pump permease subunit
LQEHSWKVRTAKWGLCLSIVLVELGVIYAGFGVDGEFDVSFAVMLGLFGAIYSFIGVNGFLEEKRSGALELILVTPLKPSRLIYGRVLGLWNTFMPAAIILAGCHGIWWWLNLRHFEFVEEIARDAVLICAFFTLPIFATYFALRLKNLILAGFFTWLALCIPPFLAYGCTNLFGGVDPDYDGALAVSILVVASILFSLLTCFLIHHSLSRRIYPF